MDRQIGYLLTLVLEMALYRHGADKKVVAQWEEVVNRFLHLLECTEIKLNSEDGIDGALRRIKEKYWKVTKDIETIWGLQQQANHRTIQVLFLLQNWQNIEVFV